MPAHQLSTINYQLIAWHGWRISVPESWNPVKVDGDWEQGHLLLADLQSAKLGVRWKRMKRGDPSAWASRALREEVGKLAAEEAKDLTMPDPASWRVSKLYVEPEPPGRNIWVGWSETSGRVIEIVHHVKTQSNELSERVLPSLSDSSPSEEQAWSIFDLSVRSPAGWALQWYRLNAGDLSLAFRKKRKTVQVRQVGPAELALGRQKIDKWMSQQDKTVRKLYRPLSDLSDLTLEFATRSLAGKRGLIRRKRRFFWAFLLPKALIAIGLHDTRRNRLIFAQGDDEEVMKQMLGSVGWVKGGGS